jgi:HEAT repeat protein
MLIGASMLPCLSATVLSATAPADEPEYRQQERLLISYWQSQLKNNYPLIRKSALRNLANLRAVETVPTIVETLKDSDPEVRVAAAKTLGLLGDESSMSILKELSNRDKDASVRKQAGRAIDQLKERLEQKRSTQPTTIH